MRKHSLIPLIIFITLISLTSTSSESYKLKKILSALPATSDPVKKAGLLIDAGNEAKGSNPDTALYFFSQAEIRSRGLSDKKQQTYLQTRILLGKISISLSRGDMQSAMTFDSLALVMARLSKNKELEAQALMSLGSIYYTQSLFEKAQQINRKALELNRQTNDRKTEGKILTNMGTIEFILGNVSQADSLFRIPLKIAHELKDDDLLAASYLNIGLMNYYLGKYKEAAEGFHQAVQVYLTIDGRDGLALCYQNLSNIGFATGDLAMTLDNTWQHLALTRQLGDLAGQGKALHNMGEVNKLLGDYEQALSYFLMSMNLKARLPDQKEAAMTEFSIGQIHYQTGNLKQADEYFRKALANWTSAKYKTGIGKGYDAVGTVMMETGKNDSALFYYTKAEKIFTETGDESSLAVTFLNKGKTFIAKRDFVSSEKYFRSGLSAGYSLNDPQQLFNACLQLAQLRLVQAEQPSPEPVTKKQFLREAFNFASKAFLYADSSGLLKEKRDASACMLDVSEALGNTSEALRFARITMALSDSLSAKQRADAMAHAEIRWKAEKNQDQIEKLISEKQLQTQVINQKSSLNTRLTLLIIFVLVVVILMIIITIQYLRNKDKQEKILYQLHLNEITLLKHKNLSNRLSPHLFFNLLNSFSAGSDEPEKMKRQVHTVASLLRLSLENAEVMAIPLSRELEMVRAWLELQEVMVPQPFTWEISVQDTVSYDTLVPAMCIHIPVENAIKHGLMPLEEIKLLKINIENQSDELLIHILDNGVGRSESANRTRGTGTGLKVIYQTIHLLNRQNRKHIAMTIEDQMPRGTAVRMAIPHDYSFEI
jgi:tetratricopeptide (TPR) repeat protein